MRSGQHWYRSKRTKIILQVAAAVLAAAGVVIIATDLARGHTGQAGAVSDLASGICELLGVVAGALSTLFGERDPSTPAQVADAASALVGEIREQWLREATRRGIEGTGIADLSWTVTRGSESLEQTILASNGEDGLLDRILGLYQESPNRRLLITGPPGSGKSTLLILLTSALMRNQMYDGPIPIILTLGTWNTSSQDFKHWLLRRLNERYPSLRSSAYGNNALEQLFDKNRILLLLDGLDELETAPSVVSAIKKSWPAERPLVLASRADNSGEGELLLADLGGIGQHAHLMPLSPEETFRYIANDGSADQLQKISADGQAHQPQEGMAFQVPAGIIRWLGLSARRILGRKGPSSGVPRAPLRTEDVPDDFLVELSNLDSPLSRVLRIPFYAYLARETMATNFVHRFEELKATAVIGQERGVRKRLISEFVERAFRTPNDESATWGDPKVWGTSSRRRQILDIASLAQKADDNNIAWWRFQRLVPAATWAACIGITLGVMYWLTRDLPSGLRRGTPLGFTLSIAIGITRGTVKGKQAGVIAAAVSIPIILATGAPVVGFWQALEDSVELSLAVGLGTAMLPSMFGSWRGLIKAGGIIVVLMGLLTGAIQAIQHGALSGVERFLDTSLGASEVILIPGIFSMLLSLTSLADQPNSMSFSFRGRSERLITHLLIGIATGVAIGVGGGIEASARSHATGSSSGSSASYGWHVAVTYALSVGVGMGLVGGLVRWLSLPTENTSVASPLSTLRAARAAALVCVFIPPATAAIAILGLNAAGFKTPGAIVGSVLYQATALSGAGLGVAIGLVFATVLTAYPAYIIIQAWEMLVSHGGPQLSTLMAEARDRDLLRREGGIYQFRHVEIQEYLAGLASVPADQDVDASDGSV